MPRVEELNVEVLSHWFAADYAATRTPGPHLKAIIDDFIAYHGLSKRKQNAEFADSLEEFAVGGFAWERVVTRAFRDGVLPAIQEATPDVVKRVYEDAFTRALNEAECERRPRELIKPGEVEHRGIYCTPDGAIWFRQRQLEEWKCSWASAAGGLESHPDWLMQMPGYCEALGFDTAVLRAFFVNGYYDKGQMGKPVVRAWKLKWSAEEIEENWTLIEQHREVMIEEGRLDG